MADEKLTELPELTTVSPDDLLYVVDDPAGTPASKKIAVARVLQTPTIAPPSASFVTASGRRNVVTMTVTLNRLYFVPIALATGYGYTSFGVQVGAAAATGGTARVGLYSYLNGQPHALLCAEGSIATDSTGVKLASLDYDVDMGPYIFIGVAFQTNVTSLALGALSNNAIYSVGNCYLGSNGETQGFYFQEDVDGSLPATVGTLGSSTHPQLLGIAA
jgi:hypothetical protein